MKRLIVMIVLTVALASGPSAISQEAKAQDAKTPGRYMACDNHQGGGFFWVDTTVGKIWRADIGKPKNEWAYLGQVKDAKNGEIGTYIPYVNKNGGGLFVLNTVTGEGWWTNGKEWKPFDKPSDAIKTAQKESSSGATP